MRSVQPDNLMRLRVACAVALCAMLVSSCGAQTTPSVVTGASGTAADALQINEAKTPDHTCHWYGHHNLPLPLSCGTPTPTPSPTRTPAPCDAPHAKIGDTKYDITVKGTVPAGGVAGPLTSGSGSWYRLTYGMPPPATSAPIPTHLPTPPATSAPVATPVPTPTVVPTPLYLYGGTYTITSASTPTTGCFELYTTTDGSVLSSNPAYGLDVDAYGTGNIKPPITPYALSFANPAAGSLRSVSAMVSASGGTGTISLDNGDVGTLSLAPPILTYNGPAIIIAVAVLVTPSPASLAPQFPTPGP